MLNWQIRGLLAFENAPGVDAAQTIYVRSIASVADQTTGGGELAKLVDRWNAVAEGECAELRGVAVDSGSGVLITSAAAGNCAAVAKAASKSASVLAWST
jgi:hypothetical protein